MANMKNNKIASMINDLSDDDFYEVFTEFAKMHQLENINNFTEWLNSVLHEIEERNESMDFNIKNGVLLKYKGTDKEVVIPNGVTRIDDEAFAYCTSLTSIIIPDSVTSIGYQAFLDCTSLTSITIPDSVTNIGESAFWNTAYHKNKNSWEDDVLYIGNHLIEKRNTLSGNYDIKQGTKIIADDAFGQAGLLENIAIPNSVTSIGNWAFANCNSLKSITIPDSVTDIGDYTFANCHALTNVTISSNTKMIRDNVFYGCNNLSDLYVNVKTEISRETLNNLARLPKLALHFKVD